MFKTKEGGVQYEHSLDHFLEFFSKAGSLYDTTTKRNYYQGEESALSLFQKAWIVDNETAMKLLFWLRDCRGGAGNRSAFRSCLKWLTTIPGGCEWVKANLEKIIEHGRYDDLKALFGTPVEMAAANLWANAIANKNPLAAKWCDRKLKPVKHALLIKKEGVFRKLLAKIRKEHIVEHKMSTNRWNEIAYHTVPSLAMARYTKAFGRHDEQRFNSYKEGLKSGKETVHASVLFPHDCVRTAMHGDREIADAQFEALPNYLEGTNERIIVIADTSGSMCSTIGGSVQAVHVSQGMALYCSEKIGKDNPFYRKFIGFCSESRFVDWKALSFSEAVDRVFDGACGATRIDVALDSILKTASFFNLPKENMPTALLIVSDMQFHGGYMQGCDSSASEVNAALSRWTNAGYDTPKIIYWNTAGYAGAPDTAMSNNVALVSGFSPAILKAIFAGEDLTPLGVMYKALEKYEVIRP